MLYVTIDSAFELEKALGSMADDYSYEALSKILDIENEINSELVEFDYMHIVGVYTEYSKSELWSEFKGLLDDNLLLDRLEDELVDFMKSRHVKEVEEFVLKYELGEGVVEDGVVDFDMLDNTDLIEILEEYDLEAEFLGYVEEELEPSELFELLNDCYEGDATFYLLDNENVLVMG